MNRAARILVEVALVPMSCLLLVQACAPPAPPAPEGLPLEFRPADLGTRLGPRFLPASVSIPLSASDRGDLQGEDLLEGFLPLGPKTGEAEPGFPLFLGRSGAGGGWKVLFVEDGSAWNRRVEPTAGHLGGQPVFRLDLQVEHPHDGASHREGHVVEILVPSGEEPPPDLLTAYGFGERIARVESDGADLTVLLSDGNSDGVFGLEDHWVVLEDAHLLAAPFTPQEAREVGDFAWAAGRAWRLDLEGTAGRLGRLIPHDPGWAESEDADRRNTYPQDRAATRAGRPLECPPRKPGRGPAGAAPGRPGATRPAEGEASGPAAWRGEAEQGEDAAEGAAPRLLLFDAAACAQCRAMDRFVLTAERVASAGEGILCERIDAAANPGALQKRGLSGVPSGVLLDPAGGEITRFEGYRGVDEMSAILNRALR